MKRYTYSALVRLTPSGGQESPGPLLPETGARVAVRAAHHETHHSKTFSALISSAHGEPLVPSGHSIQATITVLGEDAGDYLDAGDTFALWRGHDIGRGVISRRLRLWAETA